MKLFIAVGRLLLLLVTLAFPARALAEEKPDALAAAEEHFKAGRFGEAEELYTKALTREPKLFQAILRMGNIALLKNRLEDAERYLKLASALKADDRSVTELLAEVCYRRDDFAQAAPLFRSLDKEAVARKLESFKGTTPYKIDGTVERSQVKFVHTDPLPLLQVKANGSEANFIIDTGASEIYLDTEFAAKVGAAHFGSTTGTYGGGQQAATEHGRVDSLTLGDFVIRNVPALILSTKRFAAAAQGKEVHGILGTSVLAHFLATIDYPNGELILRRKTAEQLKALEAEGAVAIPFWMAGDHFIVAWGRVNKSQPLLWFVDTGLAGGGFIPAESTLKDGGIQLPQGSEAEGIGGGGKVKIVPFTVDELSLGPLTERNVFSFFGPFPPSLEHSEGFRIAGIVSHQFLRPYALTFDFTGMRLFLKRKSP